MRNSRLLVPRNLGADRAEIADQGNQHGEASFTAIVFDTCRVGETPTTFTGPDTIEPEPSALGNPTFTTLKCGTGRDR